MDEGDGGDNAILQFTDSEEEEKEREKEKIEDYLKCVFLLSSWLTNHISLADL